MARLLHGVWFNTQQLKDRAYTEADLNQLHKGYTFNLSGRPRDQYAEAIRNRANQ